MEESIVSMGALYYRMLDGPSLPVNLFWAWSDSPVVKVCEGVVA